MHVHKKNAMEIIEHFSIVKIPLYIKWTAPSE